MKILVRAPNWVGDQILAYPFFHFLRRAYPQARIDAVCVPWVASLQFRDLVNEVIELSKPTDRTWSARYRFLEESGAMLRAKGPWDLAISLPDSFSSAWMLFRAGARQRRGYVGDGRALLLNSRVRKPVHGVAHRSQAYVDLLPEGARPSRPATEFWGVPPENDLDPGVPGVIAGFDPLKAWPEFEPLELELPSAARGAKDYWVLAPGSAAEARRWPIERFAQLARKIHDETGMIGVIVGGPAEAALAEQLRDGGGRHLVDFTAQGAVASLWRVFREARFTVANDSGLAHVAALCGSPVHIIWGAGVPQRTKPLGPGKVSLTLNPVDCWPCERNSCPQAPGRRLECLNGISPDQVWKEIRSGILSPSGPKNTDT